MEFRKGFIFLFISDIWTISVHQLDIIILTLSLEFTIKIGMASIITFRDLIV